MDLSILIPVYKWDCSDLVNDLETQARALGISYEIIEADDEQLQMGRAGIRNHLADLSRGRRLLFIDCDAGVERDTFLKEYLAAADASGAQVVCGGLYHAAKMPSADVSLRWRYEHRADRRRGAHYRSQHPCEHFTPFNFLIERELFMRIRFDKRIKGYGHEDTLFGRQLAEQGITPLHIDNPLIHLGLESNRRYLEKTRSALRNLRYFHADLNGYSSVLKAFRVLRRLGFNNLAATLFNMFRPQLEKHLCGSRPSLFLFKLYKLGYYCHL